MLYGYQLTDRDKINVENIENHFPNIDLGVWASMLWKLVSAVRSLICSSSSSDTITYK